jgi:hypothetical protein
MLGVPVERAVLQGPAFVVILTFRIFVVKSNMRAQPLTLAFELLIPIERAGGFALFSWHSI